VSDENDVRRQLLEETLDAFRREHSDLQDTWKALETKAQSSVGVSGVFIGFTLAFAKDITADTSRVIIVLTLLALILLTAALMTGALSLRLREVTDAPSGDNVRALIWPIVQLPDTAEVEARRLGALGDQTRQWRDTVSAVRLENASKAKWTFQSQVLLLSAIIVAALLAGISVLERAGTPPATQPSPDVIINEMHEL
jgi:hypothetical protein